MFFKAIASCHSISIFNNSFLGDPLEIKMFKSTRWLLDENTIQSNDKDQRDGVLAYVRPSANIPKKRNLNTTSQASRVTEQSVDESMISEGDHADLLAGQTKGADFQYKIGILQRFDFASSL